jgi:LPXTG-motif cell wall-anchored protein
VYYKEGEVEAVDTGDTNSPWGLTMLLSALAMTLVVISAKRKALQL